MNQKSLLEMSAEEAKKFFLKSESYFNVRLPKYFNLDAIIEDATHKLGTSDLGNILSNGWKGLKDASDVNLMTLSNKDPKYTWRNFQLIHPILYVDLVNILTQEVNWQTIINRFEEFQEDPRVKCHSIPVESTGVKSDKAEQILKWWKNLEQSQIELALDYEYCIHSDITDCYPSIYTHSIAWALHGKEWAKNNRRLEDGVGHLIDNRIQCMQGGQTNGIPQGSVLMDFIAEMLLGYADLMLLQRIKDDEITNFQILRYRDDYRIFSNNLSDAEIIMKYLSEILLDLNLKINASKTFLCTDIINDGIKRDKLYWSAKSTSFYTNYEIVTKSPVLSEDDITDNDDVENIISKKRFYKLSLQKHLLQIKILGDKFPNCGQLTKALNEFYKYRIFNLKTGENQIEDVYQLISILTSIMILNPRTIELSVIIICRLLEFVSNEDAEEIINKILRKYSRKVKTDYIEIWLQRIGILVNKEKTFDSLLCQIVYNSEIKLWNSNWLSDEKKIDDSKIIDSKEMDELSFITPLSESNEFENQIIS